MAIQTSYETELRCQVGWEGLGTGDTQNLFVMFLRLQVSAFWLTKVDFD